MLLSSRIAWSGSFLLALFVIGTVLAHAAPISDDGGETQGEQAEEDWPGSFGAKGLKTRFAVSGFAELDVIYDTDAISTPCDFITAAIATDGGTAAEGADGRTSFCVNAPRLRFETRTPIDGHRLTTYVSFDFFGDSTSDSPEPRLRQFYGELTGLAGGTLLAGQAWSTFFNGAAWPDILDYEGPPSVTGIRQPLVRWTRGFAERADFVVSAETPSGHDIQGADLVTRWPDLVVAVVRNPENGGNLKGAAIVRDLRASSNIGPVVSTVGWGVSGSGKFMLGERNNVEFEVTFGDGIGSMFEDSPPDAFFDTATSRLEALPVLGGFAGFGHDWTRKLSTTVVLGGMQVDNPEAQPGDAFKRSRYALLNLIHRHNDMLMYGIEIMRGERVDKDGAEGTDNRLQLTVQFSFGS